MTTEKNVEIYRCISILPDDYQEMDNKPTMNGATIEGDLTAKDLKLMSSDSDDYQSISKEEAAEKFIPVIDKDGNVHKISVSDLPTGGGNGNAGEEDTENTPVKPAELLAEPVVFETAEHEGMHQGDSMIGLVAGKTYKVSALVGANATPFEYEAVAVKTDEEGGSITQIATPDDALFNNHLAIWIMDAAGEMNGEPINTNIIMIGGHGEGSDPENGSGYSDEFFANETYSPVIINSIKEVETVVEYASKKSVDELTERVITLEKASNSSLLKTPIEVNESNGLVETMAVYAANFPTLGLEDGKKYKVTYTFEEVQYEEICTAIDREGMLGLAGKLDDGSDSEFTLTFGNTVVNIIDKMEFKGFGSDEGTEYSDTLACIMAAPQSSEVAMSLPFRIDSIDEAKNVNLLIGEITYDVIADNSRQNLSYALGLEANKTYQIEGVFGSNATPYVVTATTLDMYEEVKKEDISNYSEEIQNAIRKDQEDCKGIIGFSTKVIIDEDRYAENSGNGYIGVSVYDNAVRGEGDFYDYSSNACIVSFSWSAAGDGSPFMVRSIIEIPTEHATKLSVDNLETNIANIRKSYATKSSVEELEERVATLEKANDISLLSAPIEVAPNLDPTNLGTLTHSINNTDTIGLVDMKDYNITYTYKGIQYTQKAQAQLKDSGVIILEAYQEEGSTSDATLTIDNSIQVQISDKWTIDITSGSGTYDENSMSIMAYSMSSPGAFQTFETFSIDSIAEVLSLRVTKEEVEALDIRVTTLEKSNDTNLLGGEPITIQGNADGDSFKVVDFSLGMKAGKQYEIKANVDGQDVVVYGKTENPIENVVMLLPVDGGDFVMLVDQSVSLMLFDNCDLIDGEPAPANNKCVLGLQEYDEIAHLVILNSITEVQVEYATKESIDKIEERVTALEKGDEPQNLLSEPIKSAEPWVDNEVNYGFWEMPSLGLEVGKTYRITGYYGGESLDSSEGATTFSEDVVALSAEDEMGVVGGVMLIYSKELVADGGYSFGFGFFDKVRMEGDMTVPPTPVYDESVTNFSWDMGGSDQYRPLVKNAVIESIAEAQVEYATVSYVDNLIAEINDKLEALLNGTEA